MSEFRKNLLDRVIRLYGFEHRITIGFAETCERFPDDEQWDNTLWTLCKTLLECPLVFED